MQKETNKSLDDLHLLMLSQGICIQVMASCFGFFWIPACMNVCASASTLVSCAFFLALFACFLVLSYFDLLVFALSSCIVLLSFRCLLSCNNSVLKSLNFAAACY